MSKVKSNFLLLDRCKTSMTEEFYITFNIPIPLFKLKIPKELLASKFWG